MEGGAYGSLSKIEMFNSARPGLINMIIVVAVGDRRSESNACVSPAPGRRGASENY